MQNYMIIFMVGYIWLGLIRMHSITNTITAIVRRSCQRRRQRWHQRLISTLLLPKTKAPLANGTLANAYEPSVVESEWYDWWCARGLHAAPSASSSSSSQVIILPPPNVTGALHIGHALTNSIQDAFVRHARMRGVCIQWMPGLDHAGIATQSVVEQHLLKHDGVRRDDIGRERFEQCVWEWKHKYGDRINRQQRVIGSSLDWAAKYFTLDQQRSEAVIEAFVRLHERGLIERGSRLVNWDCYLRTTISDIEVDMMEIEPFTQVHLPGRGNPVEFGVLHSFAYKLESSMAAADVGDEVVVATTRLETMFGDAAVAVHPDDERYAHLRGKHGDEQRWLIQPITGRRVPLVFDDTLVNPEMGTGAVKVTPAHDMNDYACGERHGLTEINIMNDNGTLNDSVGDDFAGMDRFDVRPRIIEALQACDAYRGAVGHQTRIAVCSRSGDVLEPMLKPQWFVNMTDMTANAMDAVRTGRLSLLPQKSGYAHKWHEFLANTTDWCVSRQLWWGHRIPAYRVLTTADDDDGDSERWVVARSYDEAVRKARELYADSYVDVQQDTDVLDTWFSSALLPLSCRGWPLVAAPTPLTLMETGGDILFFWVARMVMLCSELHGERTLPFDRVYLHPMVCDAQGRKMSKSRGNVIDPMDIVNGADLHALIAQLSAGNLADAEIARSRKVIESEYPKGIPQCGADALRFTLCSYTRGGRVVNFDVKRAHHFRLFCNKIYQACRYVLSYATATTTAATTTTTDGGQQQHIANIWIRSRLAACVRDCDQAFIDLEFAAATDALYRFFQMDFCNEYLEYSKVLLRQPGRQPMLVDATQATLVLVMEMCLRLFHPFMPYLTEELWQAMRSVRANMNVSIVTAAYPRADDISEWCVASDDDVEASMIRIRAVIATIRSMRAQHANVVDVKCVRATGPDAVAFINEHGDFIKALLRIDCIDVCPTDADNDGNSTIWRSVTDGDSSGGLMVGFRIVNTDALRVSVENLKKKLRKLETKHAKQLRSTQTPDYESRVPLEVRDKQRDAIQQTTSGIESLRLSIEMLEGKL